MSVDAKVIGSVDLKAGCSKCGEELFDISKLPCIGVLKSVGTKHYLLTFVVDEKKFKPNHFKSGVLTFAVEITTDQALYLRDEINKGEEYRAYQNLERQEVE